MQRPDNGGGHGGHAKAWRAVLGRVLRCVVPVLLVLQIGGAISLAGHLLGVPLPGCTERCADDDGPLDACPPACPTCTCVHGARPAVPAPAGPMMHRPVPVSQMVMAPPSAPHDTPEPAAIFHPPRA